jgi:hypothetical protein
MAYDNVHTKIVSLECWVLWLLFGKLLGVTRAELSFVSSIMELKPNMIYMTFFRYVTDKCF